MEKRHRVFIAINLPEDVKRALTRYEEKWPEVPAKWTVRDNIHITLVFLGDLTDEESANVCIITKEVAERYGSINIILNKILYGPTNKLPPKMIWVEGEKSKEISDLKNDLEKSLLEKVRFAPDGRGFNPHITLARIRETEFRQIEPEEIPEVDENIDYNFMIESIEVMESELKRGGPQYTVLESCPLKSEDI